jgi:adenosine deaminase
MTPSDERLQQLPKAELHMHLDGSLRPETMLDLAADRNVDMPAETAEALSRYMLVSDAASLEEYLERFEVTLSVMQDVEAVERIAYECVIDHALENVRYVELRFCPQLNTVMGARPDDVLAAALAGMRRAETEAVAAGHGSIRANLIVCALRSHDPGLTFETAELAIAFQERGVCGFDIAGGEAGNPVSDHAAAFDLVARAGVPITIHAGEGFGAESIRQALEIGHAMRIGHGTRLFEDPSLVDEVRRRGVPLEVCLTSNLQTRVVSSYASHPAQQYLRAGIPVSLGTDNRLMSGVTLTDEYMHARDGLGLSWSELRAVSRAGFEHAFVTPHERTALLAAFDAEVSALA